MGRAPTFEAADAVRAARALFWREGYEGASMSALQQATGLNSSSIYHAFGSKRGLFEAAIVNYLDEVVRPGLAPLLSADDVSPSALADHLERLAAEVGEPGLESRLPDGCLLVNTACVGIGREDAVREVISAYRAELLRAFGAGVDAARPDASDDERARLVELCVAAMISALVMVRVDRAAARSTLLTAAATVSADPDG